MNDEQNIEKLFSKKFEKFEIKSSDEEWTRLSSKLSMSNFLRFSFATFNVYYLLALICFAGTAAITCINNYNLTKKIEHLEQSIETYQKRDSIRNLPTVPIDSAHLYEDAIKNTPEHKKEINTDLSIKNTPESAKKDENLNQPSNMLETIQDTTKKKEIKPTQSDSVSHKMKKVKKTVTIKKESVVVKDTIVITKQNKSK
jgi:hypothetical protein